MNLRRSHIVFLLLKKEKLEGICVLSKNTKTQKPPKKEIKRESRPVKCISTHYFSFPSDSNSNSQSQSPHLCFRYQESQIALVSYINLHMPALAAIGKEDSNVFNVLARDVHEQAESLLYTLTA